MQRTGSIMDHLQHGGLVISIEIDQEYGISVFLP